MSILSLVGFKKKSSVPGVMITQWVEELPEGKTHPDFTRKPIALTIQEGTFNSVKMCNLLPQLISVATNSRL